jgi:hypothetical protein
MEWLRIAIKPKKKNIRLKNNTNLFSFLDTFLNNWLIFILINDIPVFICTYYPENFQTISYLRLFSQPNNRV